MSDLILSLFTTGPPEHIRYMVANQDLEFWTGKNWTNTEAKASLYVNVNDAGRAIQELLLIEHGDKPLRRFIAPVHVDLYANMDLNPGEIGDWLVKVARLTIDAEMHGNGPTKETLGLLHIDWSQLRKVKD